MCLAEFAATYVAILFNLGYPTEVELLRNEVEDFMMPLNRSIASGDWETLGCTCNAMLSLNVYQNTDQSLLFVSLSILIMILCKASFDY